MLGIIKIKPFHSSEIKPWLISTGKLIKCIKTSHSLNLQPFFFFFLFYLDPFSCYFFFLFDSFSFSVGDFCVCSYLFVCVLGFRFSCDHVGLSFWVFFTPFCYCSQLLVLQDFLLYLHFIIISPLL